MSLKVAVVNRPISVDGVVRTVKSLKAGALVTFVGTVRSSSDGMRVRAIEIEAAEDLASADLKRIGRRAMDRFDVTSLAIRHRTGKLRLGDAIVVVAVSAPHRKDAFLACEFVIDELKKTTPIWKKELGKHNERWVKQEV